MRGIGRHQQHALAGRLAASAIADAHVVLPTPPLPPKNSTRLSIERRIASAARQVAERRSIHAHAPVPQVELLEQVGIDVEEVQRRRVRQPDDLHVAEQQEQIVELGGLQAQLTFVCP